MVFSTELVDLYDRLGHQAFVRDVKISHLLDNIDIDIISPYYKDIEGLRAPNILFHYTDEEKLELIDCQNDPKRISQFLKLGKNSQPTNLVLRDYQREIIDHIHNDRFTLFNVSRQIGMTSTVAVQVLHYILNNTDKTILVLSPKMVISMDFDDLIYDFYKSLPYFIKPGIVGFDRGKWIKFDNGCRILFTSTLKSSLGHSIDYLVLPDFAHHPQSLDIRKALFPSISVHNLSRILIYSSPNSGTDAFALIYLSKTVNNWKTYEYPWNVIPNRSQDWVNSQIQALGSEISFIREYECGVPGTIGYDRAVNLRSLLGS